ncbi:ArsR/SmtB family transcription factor [Longispora albida]|uniref:ArsR/SmtB family transcription factor n=1 Tax=Longispora albida TaxID=203523 RepID=UPI00037FDB0F|nr:winged helix-turn-helix domain-containing protein [Longispora albida]
MLRIYFTSEDVARTRVAMMPDPMWEMVLSLQMLRRQRGDLLFGPWRRRTITALRGAGLTARLRTLLRLTPIFGYFPDFLTPGVPGGLAGGLEAIRSTPAELLGRDLRQLSVREELPSSTRLLADGDVAALVRLTDTMAEYFGVAITPYQPQIDAAVDHDRAIRTQALVSSGVEGMLGSFGPRMEWTAGELRVPGHRDQELYLGGRGLVLVPSYFCLVNPITLFDPLLPPVLVYPVEGMTSGLIGPEVQRDPALGQLLGQTRAAMLAAIGAGCTTSDLARRTGVSAASASEHATVLRRAGLVSSHRSGNRMVHHLTRLGWSLLNHTG